MSDVRMARKRLKAALRLLDDPAPEHHQDVRSDLLVAYQTLTQLAEVHADPPRKVAVYQDYRLNRTRARTLVEEALQCLHDAKAFPRKSHLQLSIAADYVQDAYLMI
ncbi:hypothetical protein [Deinococcus roseus]|nr:hypothetical protein [Deinococcus roseus]